MKRSLPLVFALAALFAMSGWLIADDKCCGDKAAGGKCCDKSSTTSTAVEDGDKAAKKIEPKCPVSGEKASKDVTVDYKGGKVCFCCAGCAAKFKESQAKFETKANEQLVLTGQAKQKGCPMSGGKLNDSTKIEIDGIPVAFCCAGCQGKVKEASVEKQREIVFGKGFDKAFAVAKKEKKEEKKEEKATN